MAINIFDISNLRTEHLLIFHCGLPFIDRSEVITKIVLQFSSRYKNYDIIECGIKILPDETDGSNYGASGDKDGGYDPWYRETLEEEEDDDDSDFGYDETSDEDGCKSESGERPKTKMRVSPMMKKDLKPAIKHIPNRGDFERTQTSIHE